jgi:hypothetical protein
MPASLRKLQVCVLFITLAGPNWGTSHARGRGTTSSKLFLKSAVSLLRYCYEPTLREMGRRAQTTESHQQNYSMPERQKRRGLAETA